MNNEITISNIETFTLGEMSLRGMLIEGEPWFVAMDVAKALDYSETRAMTRKLDHDEIQTCQIGGFGNRGASIINESGLYASVLRSRRPEAKTFKKWVTSEVLPAIRKTGSYSVEPKAPQTYVEALEALLEAEKARLALEEKSRELEPKAKVHDKVLEPGSSIGFCQVCATLRDDYPQVLEPHVEELLRKEGLIQKRSVASTAKARNAGYAIDVVAGNFGGETRTTTRWTPKGISYIIYLIESQGL